MLDGKPAELRIGSQRLCGSFIAAPGSPVCGACSPQARVPFDAPAPAALPQPGLSHMQPALPPVALNISPPLHRAPDSALVCLPSAHVTCTVAALGSLQNRGRLTPPLSSTRVTSWRLPSGAARVPFALPSCLLPGLPVSLHPQADGLASCLRIRSHRPPAPPRAARSFSGRRSPPYLPPDAPPLCEGLCAPSSFGRPSFSLAAGSPSLLGRPPPHSAQMLRPCALRKPFPDPVPRCRGPVSPCSRQSSGPAVAWPGLAPPLFLPSSPRRSTAAH